jgi:chemotaxis protein CheX
MEQYIQPFIDVCRNTFQVFCKTDISAKRAFFEEKENYGSIWDISGIIGFTGEAKGAVAISLTENTALRITKTLTQKEHESLDNYVTDGVGEIINIIAGNVKKNLEEMFRLKISIPTVVKGKSHQVVWPADITRIVCIPFEIFESQTFCLSVAIEPKK